MKRLKYRVAQRISSADAHHANRADSRSLRLNESLRQFLIDLAELLVLARITPKHFGDMAAHAFVVAACKIARFRNGKVNQSRVAVLTGLRRAEVRKLMSDGRSAAPKRSVWQTRAERVIAGWATDQRYLTRSGRPRRLPISSRGVCFSSLTKEFAGDVPHRAVLDELRRMQAVHEHGRHVALTTDCAYPDEQMLNSLLHVLPLLSDGIKAGSKAKAFGPNATVQRATLKVADELDMQILRESACIGAASFLDGLKQSLQNPTTPPRRYAKAKRGLTVTILLAEQPRVGRKGGQDGR